MSRFGFDDGGSWWQQMQQGQFDADGDGIPDSLQPPGVDRSGFSGSPLATDSWAFDRDGDGRPDHWAWDSDRDGRADYWAWDSDKDGRADQWAWDRDGDGRADHWAWDENRDGRAERWAWDTNGDGQIDQWAYDANGDGNPDLWKCDHNRDGKIDTWLYDTTGNGKIDRWVYDRNQDQKPDWWAFDKNADGKPDYWERDDDRDGTAELFAFDRDGDGKPDRWLRFHKGAGAGRAHWRSRNMPRMASGIPYDPLQANEATINTLLSNAYSMCAGTCKNPALKPVRVAEATARAKKAAIVTLTADQWAQAIRRSRPDHDPGAVGALVDVDENKIYLAPPGMNEDKGLTKAQLKELRARRIGHERWHIVLDWLGIPIKANSKTKWKSGPFAGEKMSVHHAVLFRAGNY